MNQPSFDLGYDDLPDPTFSVAELAGAIDQVLRRGFRDGAWVRGEIEGMQQRPNGHVYFSLAERGDDGQATLPVVLFAGNLARFRGLLAKHRMRLANGLAVRIHVRIEFYAPSGRVSLVMDGLDPTYTLGQLAADRDQLLHRLVGEGLLDVNKRLRLPVAPLRIGVVTSIGSAAWHDLVHELEASGVGFHVLATHATVQGEGAPEAVVAALRTLARHEPDVILLVRGGGSRTDLATFDDERVARAIAASPVPVWTGLGHEIDRAIADEVAHSAHKTPTACAAALVARVVDTHRRAEAAWSAVVIRASAVVDAAERRLDLATARAGRRTDEAVGRASARLDANADRLGRAARRAAVDAERELVSAGRRVIGAGQLALREADRSIALVAQRAAVLDPARTLARGWSITHTAGGRLVREPADAPPGAVLRTTIAGGVVLSTALAADRTPADRTPADGTPAENSPAG